MPKAKKRSANRPPVDSSANEKTTGFTKKIDTPNFWRPRSNNPRICGALLPIFLGLYDSTFDLPRKFGILERKRANANSDRD